MCIFPGLNVNDRQTYISQSTRSADSADLIGHHYYECRYTKSLNEANVSGRSSTFRSHKAWCLACTSKMIATHSRITSAYSRAIFNSFTLRTETARG